MIRGRSLVSLVFALIVAAGCADHRLVAAAPPPAPVDPSTQMSALEQRIFDIVQDERRAINPQAKSLALDSELLGVARHRSQDMAAKNYVAHKSPDGETSASLIMDEDENFEGLLGENLASQQFVRQSNIDVDACARRFVASWLASPQNKENLAFASYDRSAVGAAVSGNTIYVTELFAADLGSHARDPKKREVSEWTVPAAAIPASKGTNPPPPGPIGASPP